MKENVRGAGPIGAAPMFVIALGDVSSLMEMMMTHTRYAFIKANWHSEIVDQALDGCTEVIARDQVDLFDVPGAFEMPLLARDLARTGRYGAVICAALVVDGGIYRHDFVAAVDGLMQR
jgi:6,7-dimethyl-8-ribityllumazine synthase